MPFELPPQTNFIERIRSRIAEGRDLTVFDYESVIIPLFCRLDATTTRGHAQFIIPQNKRFRLQGVRPILSLAVASDETLVTAGSWAYNAANPDIVFEGGDVFDRMYAKAMNCVLDLNFDSMGMVVNINPSLRLSDLLDDDVDFFDTPTSFPQDTSIDLYCSLQDSTASGSDTDYGLALYGQLIRL